jgi:endonuclease/exonuclease/phosphatase family metal-dependent hydrolase
MRVLTWNLMHGRAVPGAGRDLLDDFAAALAGWEWDAALLQEVPPWWPRELARRLGATQRLVLTSRNALLPVRRAIAVRWPDLMKSQGGGANAILVRQREILEHRTLRLRRLPERRWLQVAHVDDSQPLWLGNLHLTAYESGRARSEAERAAAAVRAWSGGLPAVLGGDFNLRELSLEGFEYVGGRDVDHVLVRGLRVTGPPEVPDRGSLSDHPPLVVSVG